MDNRIDPKEVEDVIEGDPDWIEEKKAGEDDFEFELFLSSDGKQTVHVKATTPSGKKGALRKATEVYDYIIARYGTKQAQAVREYGNGKEEVNQDTCKHINVKFAQSKTEKNPGRWFKSCKDCGKFLGWQ